MTDWLDVSDTTPRIDYTVGSTSRTTFDVPFLFFEDEDLVVSVDGTVKTLDSDYTVTGEEDEDGGTVTFATAQSNCSVSIVRQIEIALNTHIPTFGPLDVGSINLQFSRFVAIQQELDSRAIQIPSDEGATDNVLAPIATRKNRLLGFGTTGELIYSAGPTYITDTLVGVASVDSRSTLETTVIDADTTTIISAGLLVPGDTEIHVYDRISTPSPVKPWHAQSADGAYWKLKAKVAYPSMFPSSGADDTTSIQAAIDYAFAESAEVRLAAKHYYVSEYPPGSDYCLVLPSTVKFTGAGMERSFIDPAGVGSTVDIIRVDGLATVNGEGLHIADFWIGSDNSYTRDGRHGIYIKTSTTAGYVNRAVIERVRVAPNMNSGNGIYILNDNPLNTSGAYTMSTIRNCFLGNGIFGLSIGDSNNFIGNTITGPGAGIDLTLIDDAGDCLIDANNITSEGAAILINNARNPKIRNNNIENISGTGSANGAVIEINGLADTIGMAEVVSNSVTIMGTSTATRLIRIGNANGTLIELNSLNAAFLIPKAIEILNSASNTMVGTNQYSVDVFTDRVTDAGLGTRGVSKALTLGASFAAVSLYDAPNFSRGRDGLVSVAIFVNCTSPSNQVVGTLPVGFRPAGKFRVAAYATISGVAVPIALEVSSDGSILFVGSNTATQLTANVSFYVDPAVIANV